MNNYFNDITLHQDNIYLRIIINKIVQFLLYTLYELEL